MAVKFKPAKAGWWKVNLL